MFANSGGREYNTNIIYTNTSFSFDMTSSETCFRLFLNVYTSSNQENMLVLVLCKQAYGSHCPLNGRKTMKHCVWRSQVSLSNEAVILNYFHYQRSKMKQIFKLHFKHHTGGIADYQYP